MITTTDTIAHLLPLTSEERRDLAGRYAAGAYDIGDDGIAYLVFRGEWISDEQVQALLGCVSPGTLHGYDAGEAIRPATAEEAESSREAATRDGGAGVITVDGTRCYVVD